MSVLSLLHQPFLSNPNGGKNVIRHTLPLPSHVGLVHFHRTLKRLFRTRVPGWPEPMRHEPSTLLRDTELAVQLHAGD